MLEVEIHPDPATVEKWAGRGTEGSGNRRLAGGVGTEERGNRRYSGRTKPLDREEMSELSDISTENVATTRSPTDNTMMYGVTEKTATSSSFSERVKNTLGIFFQFTMATGTSDEAEIKEEEEEDDEQDGFGSQRKRIMKKHRDREVRLGKRLALNCLEPIG